MMITKMILIAMVVVMMMAAVPVFAGPPERETYPIANSNILAECDGFNVIDEYEGTVTRTEFYDKDGALERTTWHVNAQDRVYNSESGFEVFYSWAYNQAVDPDTNVYFIRGEAYNITVPGYGIVYFDSGLGIFVLVDGEFVEIKFSGNYQADDTLLCEAMNQ
jgi:hypothetical protein